MHPYPGPLPSRERELEARQTLISLDLETTGLDSASDEIIEIGAIKFQGDTVIDTFHTLVNPTRAIPSLIQALTGISDQDVAKAPLFSEIGDALAIFLASYPVVGHNVGFDLAFLGANGIRPVGAAYDTVALAQVLLPTFPDYSLAALARSLGIDHLRPHRAAPDAEATMKVFVQLLQRATELSPSVLSELRRLTARTEWPIKHLFLQLLEQKQVSALTTPSESGLEGLDLASLAERLRGPKPLSANPKKTRIDEQELARLLEPGGAVARSFPGFEQRAEQTRMLRAVADALNEGKRLVVEAGTGVGKSLAYLLPAIFFAVKSNARVVVSTHTINLQQQLLDKDIPAVVQALRGYPGFDVEPLSAAQLKGKGNYLCLKRWSSLRTAQGLSLPEVKLLCRTLVWLGQTQTGDRGELNLTRSELSAWDKVSAQPIRNPAAECPYFKRNLCFLNSNRRLAAGAHLLVVNHALLLADLAKGGGLLPDYDYLIIDEAHTLEEVATAQFGFEVVPRQIEEFLLSIGVDGRTGLLGGLVARVKRQELGRSVAAALETVVASVSGKVSRARAQAAEFFRVLTTFILHHTDDRGEYERQLRITGASRAQPEWVTVDQSYENMSLLLKGIQEDLGTLHRTLEGLSERQLEDSDGALMEVSAAQQTADELLEHLESAFVSPDKESVYWCVLHPESNAIAVKSAPISVAALVQERLFSQKESVVLTSATLSTGGEFAYIKGRLGLEDPEELLLGTPFDYEKATLLYLPTDIPEPDSARYPHAVKESLMSIVRAAGGRTLALFTSYAALRGAHAAIGGPLATQGIRVLAQGVSGSPNQLVRSFRTNPRAVLLGTSSFWEGVDIAGEALSVLVMTRLPFSVPTDPVYAARAEAFENPFGEFAVPQAVLRFKQGFGRLIRRKSDRGVVVVLDRRVHSRSYGELFLKSIPQCTVRSGPLREVPREITLWLADR